MRVPLSWLDEYLALGIDPGDHVAVRALGTTLDSLGLVVEGIEFIGEGLAGVVVARVISIAAIEGADRVRLATVDLGAPMPLEIVCGAQNYGIGDLVPLAPVGVTLPNGMEIARRKMRGVVSHGMLCSARELGLDEDHEGLLILARTGSAQATLPEGIRLGMELTELLGIAPDAVFDIAIEPNRPDALSIIGVARDLAARLERPLLLNTPQITESEVEAATLATVEVFAIERCSRLVGRVLQGVDATIASPPEIARRLTLAGMRPINAIVDASNYVMLETGQPTHPYDLAQLYGRGIGVRLARAGEELVTLDGHRRLLGRDGAEDLLICDRNDRPVGLAGIMGGQTSEIGTGTTEVLLEVAHFSSIGIGRTSARLGLRSEASARFWRGTDPEGLERAADRFCELVVSAHLAQGRPAPVIARGRLESAPANTSRREVTLRPRRVNAYLGTALSDAEMTRLLLPLGFTLSETNGELLVTVPGYRSDVTREVDLIEEIARHHGYDQIPATARRSPHVGRRSPRQELRRTLRSLATSMGAHEAWTSSIVDPELERSLGATVTPVELANPIVVNELALRTHLLGGLGGALRHNESHRNAQLRLFEIGNVFAQATPAQSAQVVTAPGLTPDGDERPMERELFGLVFAGVGDGAEIAWQSWSGIVERLGLRDEMLTLSQPAPGELLAIDWLAMGAHPTRSGHVLHRGSPVALVGEIDPRVQELLGLAPRRLGWLVIDVAELAEVPTRDATARPVSHFPSADVDLSFVLPEIVPAGELSAAIAAAAGEIVESIRHLDTYRGRGVAEDARSLSYRIRFCAIDRTLSDEEIATARREIIAHVERSLPATLRA